jgi:steroid delta-isomerase-like uncharacterized protein
VNQANVDLIRRHFQLEESGQYAAILADMHDPPEYYIPGISDEHVRSAANVTEIHTALFTAFSPLQVDVNNIFATEDWGCAEVDVHGVHVGEFDGIPPSGKHLHFNTCAVFRLRDGKIVSESVYFDRRELLRQLGIEETPIRLPEAIP